MKLKYIAPAGLTVLIAGIVVIVLAVGGGAAQTPGGHRSAAASAISVRTTALGKTLVDANGRTLYLFEGDKTNVSTLSNAGLSVWPRFLGSATVKAGPGTQAAKIGTVTSPSGVRQVTYNGHPLYYFVGDTAPGSTRGQGLNEFGALWYVLGPGGTATTRSPAQSSSASSAPAPAYGY